MVSNVKKDEEGEDVARMLVIQNVYKFYGIKPDVKWPIWRDICRSVNNEEVGWEGSSGIDRLLVGSRLLWNGKLAAYILQSGKFLSYQIIWHISWRKNLPHVIT
jgi:hypothetical protein